ASIEFLAGVAPRARLPQIAGFFPVVGSRLSKQVGPGLLAIAAAIKTQQRSKDALASLLPVGLGAQGGNYNRVFVDTFTRIVINKEDIKKVLDEQGQKLQDVLNAAGAPCWKPDPISTGTCQVGANYFSV